MTVAPDPAEDADHSNPDHKRRQVWQHWRQGKDGNDTAEQVQQCFNPYHREPAP